MTFEAALRKARRIALHRQQFMYIVRDDPDFRDYDIASTYDMDTFYFGLDPIAVIDPDGDSCDAVTGAPLGM